MYIGAHVSISKGLSNAVKTAHSIGANTMQFFSRNPRGGKARKLQEQDLAEAKMLMDKYEFGPVISHAPYTYNLASNKPNIREFSLKMIQDDLVRIKLMEVPYLVLHVGSHGGQGEEIGLHYVVEGLSQVLENIPSGRMLLMEVMAGEGSELGYDLTHMEYIINSCEKHPQLGICLDTCHLTGAGYDLRDLIKFKEQLDKTVGLSRVKAIHLNDTIFPLGSRRDRHAKIGQGYLDIKLIEKIVSDEVFNNIPFILETPNELEGYAEEIKLVKGLCKKKI